MTRDQFLQEVREELQHLKKTATPEELGKLDTRTFSFNAMDSCIYGQMTGHCHSERAMELMPKQYRTIVAYEFLDDMDEAHLGDVAPFSVQDFEVSLLEGKPVGLYTALEKYLYMTASNDHKITQDHLNIIAYLSGGLEEITLAENI